MQPHGYLHSLGVGFWRPLRGLSWSPLKGICKGGGHTTSTAYTFLYGEALSW